MRAAVCVVCVLIAGAVAEAGKPTAKQAIETTEAWLDAIEPGAAPPPPLAAAAAVTARSLFAVALGERKECKATTARTPRAIGKALACLRTYLTGRPALAPWTAQAAERLDGRLRAYRARIAAIAKTATIVHSHSQCEPVGHDMIIAVIEDRGAFKVAAVLVEHTYCGE